MSVKYDQGDKNRSGFKFAEHEMRGVPVRLAIGLRDLEKNQVEVARRDTKEKLSIPVAGAAAYIVHLLTDIQNNLLEKAKAFSSQNTHYVDDWKTFEEKLDNPGGFIYAHWDGTTDTELPSKN